jgi:hypothetical protein
MVPNVPRARALLFCLGDCAVYSADCGLCVADPACVYCDAVDSTCTSQRQRGARAQTRRTRSHGNCTWARLCARAPLLTPLCVGSAVTACVPGTFWGPAATTCLAWRYGQCTVPHQTVYGLVFGLGGAVLLIFLSLCFYFAYKVCTRRDRYSVLG